MATEEFANIRDIIGSLIGSKLIEITQHDEGYFKEKRRGFIDLMFDSGEVLRIWSLHGDEPLLVLNPSDPELEEEMFGDEP